MATSTGSGSAGSTVPPFTQTLQSITQIKFAQLSKQHREFTPHLATVRATQNDWSLPAPKRVKANLDAYQAMEENLRPAGYASKVKQHDQMLKLSSNDPSITSDIMEGWAKDLAGGFERTELKHQSGELFANLLQEWLDSGETKKAPSLDLGSGSGSGADSPDAGEKVGRKEMHEQRQTFEQMVFTANDTDARAVKAYLEELFEDKTGENRKLMELRESVRLAATTFASTASDSDIRDSIEILLKTDLLSTEKVATMKEFVENPTVLKEFTDVIKMYIQSVSSWSWPAAGVPMEMRRQLNGKYRVYLDEELLQAVFIQYVGTFWSDILYESLEEYWRSTVWKKHTGSLAPRDLARRAYYLKEPAHEYEPSGKRANHSIETNRRETQILKYFMSQLKAQKESSDAEGYDGEGEDNYSGNAAGLKQTLLNIMTAESLLNQNLRGKHTIVRSDFEWFGPSLSHTSILTTLKFFGFPEMWLKFFKTFLEVPVKFVHDGPNAEVQIRKRGVPISHALSSFFGETMLFCMDYAVFKKCDNTFLYRIHDDLWFWGSESETCVKVWETMNTFANIMGLKFNKEKTGSICIGDKPDPRLPVGKIKWGFLELEASGRFVIDQSQVDVHIKELRLQLAACKSVFSYVQAYNRYIKFFTNNFALPSRCFGLKHLEEIETTLNRIHKEIFPDHDGSVIKYLASVIETRFGATDIPAGWFFWPTSLGGLEVFNPFIDLNATRFGTSIPADPNKKFKDLMTFYDRETYDAAKLEWESSSSHKKPPQLKHFEGDDVDIFITFEEFTRGRESRSRDWAIEYELLLDLTAGKVAPEDYPKMPLNYIRNSLDSLGARGKSRQPESIDVYWKWVLAVWGQEMIDRWGGYRIVGEGMLPLGMVKAFRSSKITWEQ